MAHRIGASLRRRFGHLQSHTARWAMPLELHLAAELEGAGLRGERNCDVPRLLLTCVRGFSSRPFAPTAPLSWP